MAAFREGAVASQTATTRPDGKISVCLAAKAIICVASSDERRQLGVCARYHSTSLGERLAKRLDLLLHAYRVVELIDAPRIACRPGAGHVVDRGASVLCAAGIPLRNRRHFPLWTARALRWLCLHGIPNDRAHALGVRNKRPCSGPALLGLCELRLLIRVTLAFCIILFLGNYEEAYAFTIALTGLLLLRSAERRFWVHALLGLFLAVLALVKFTYFVQGTCAIGSVIGYYLVRRRWMALTSLTASFVVGLLACWELAGQNTGDLPLYISNSLAITAGYNAAMFTPTPYTGVVWIAAFLGMLLILQLALFWSHVQDKARLIFGSIFLMLVLFLLWKHAFTRWENHAPKFFLLFPELLLASWLLLGKSRSTQPMGARAYVRGNHFCVVRRDDLAKGNGVAGLRSLAGPISFRMGSCGRLQAVQQGASGGLG